ncbi:MAG: sigma-70 family RNA polymerase sigma factor [Acidobacteria bacterium]|nr:sigma-70 family RNA polymerase sigma factor [Acidobacteriota bacterium]
MQSGAGDVTELLDRWRRGDRQALDKLMPLVYEELRRLASYYLRLEGGARTLQCTALVNEAFLRLVKTADTEWQGRAHFFAVASRIIRHILVDHARERGAAKRGGEIELASLEEALEAPAPPNLDVIALDEALDALAQFDEQKARVVEMRFFGGLSVHEVAEALGVSTATVKRDWAVARLWLSRNLRGESRAMRGESRAGESAP